MLNALFAAFVAGAASMPHCALMCGPVHALLARGWGYQGGRLLSYTLLGAGSGAVGQGALVHVPTSIAGAAMSWTLAAVLCVAAARALGMRSQTVKRHRPWLVYVLRSCSQRPFLLGAASILLPCAALWAALLIAASAASTTTGALSMAVFAITTGAGLRVTQLTMARLGTFAGGKFKAAVFATAAALLVLLPIPRLLGSDIANEASCPLHVGMAGKP